MTNEVLLLAIPKRAVEDLFFQPGLGSLAYRYAIVLNASMFSQQSGKIRPSELCLRSAINYADQSRLLFPT